MRLLFFSALLFILAIPIFMLRALKFPSTQVINLLHRLSSLALLFSFFHPSTFGILLGISSFFFLLLGNRIQDHLRSILVLLYRSFAIFKVLFSYLALCFVPILLTHSASFSISFISPAPYFLFFFLSSFPFHAL